MKCKTRILGVDSQSIKVVIFHLSITHFIVIITPTEQVTGWCAASSSSQAPCNPKMTDWEGSLAVICDKVSEHRLLYLET